MTNTTVYSKTAGDLMREALRAANIVASEMTVETVDLERAHTALNDVLMHWMSQGLHLWSTTEALMPLNPNQQLYTFGTDHAFTDYAHATVTADFSSTDTTFSVTSTTGMTAGDNVGIQLSDGTRWWGVIDSVDSATAITTTTGVSGDGVSGGDVYAYTTAIPDPVRILSVRHAYAFTYDEITAEQISGQEYYDLPAKDTTGNVNQWYYRRQLPGGQLSVWPVASICTQLIRFTFVAPQYVPQNQIDQVQVPQEWFLPLKWSVAAELGTLYGIAPERQAVFEAKAENLKRQALDNDVEVDSFSFEPYC